MGENADYNNFYENLLENTNTNINNDSPPKKKENTRAFKTIGFNTRIYGDVILPDSKYVSRYIPPDTIKKGYFPTEGLMEVWKDIHTKYIHSDDRILKTVRGYSYHGDELANAYARGNLANLSDIMMRISVTTDKEDIPIAYQIYDHYDFLKAHGIPIPAKETLMQDGKLNMPVINAFFNENYRKISNQFVLRRLLKSYVDDLQKIIENAPRLGKNLHTYRGSKNEDFLEPGILSLINRGFSSTSLSFTVATGFTQTYYDLKCCIYDIDIDKSVPVLSIDSVSKFPGEQEILISKNVIYERNILVRTIEHESRRYLYRQIKVKKAPEGNFNPLYMKLNKGSKNTRRSNYVKINAPPGKTWRLKNEGTRRKKKNKINKSYMLNKWEY
jgi:hypothetical protein